MCGRTCLSLDQPDVLKACRYKHDKNPKQKIIKQESPDDMDIKENVNFLQPEWRSEYNCGRKFVPSYNLCPTDITPVLVSNHHFDDAEDTQYTRVVVPMMWGMIPFWHRGDYRKHGLTTNNCRFEHMLESKLYKGPFRRGQRCVVVCEGFYEWQTTKSVKPSERAVHLLYMPQKEQTKIYDRSSWQPEDVNLLKMAGLFDVWQDEQGDKIYTYSIITFESSKIMSWMHHRMPAILETEEQINTWLDFKNVSDEQALSTIRPCTRLEWYRVSNLVNNSRQKSEKCNKPLEIVKDEKPTKNKMMSAWLQVRKRSKDFLDQSESNIEADKETTFQMCQKISDSSNKDESEYAIKRPRYLEHKPTIDQSRIGDDNSLTDDTDSNIESNITT